ncbi:MAG: hypothetical protein KGI25_03610 [Thaumarchaeota archaeon]|nr:hypothetical protein [Nitrososphaerota archaeon]
MKSPLVLTNRDEYQKKVAFAAETIYQMAKAGYGPMAGNAVLGFKHGPPMLSRDGVTNIKELRSEDPFEDDIIATIRQVSEKNNIKVGDGTTAVTILAYHLLMAAQRMEIKGINPMEIARKLKEAEIIALKHIDKLKKPIGETTPQDIATVSAGDSALGQMIADLVIEVGKDGGVLVEAYEGLGVHNQLVDGFYFRKGYKETKLINDEAANQSNHYNVPILISAKPFNTEVDIAPVLDLILKGGYKEVVIIGEVSNAALETLLKTKASGILMGVPIDPPYAAGGTQLFLSDVAVMTGAQVYNGINFSTEMLGQADEVLVNGYSTTILGGKGDKKDIDKRIESLQEQLKTETNQQSIQFIKDRLGRLSGKMAIIQVGGAIEFERDEKMLRVQDAVCAVQSALKDGIVPGGGVTLARVKGTEFDDAFKQPFKQLANNAGLNADGLLAQIEAAGAWKGFNLREMSNAPIDMLRSGVIDPSLVIKEVVTNAVSVASGLITASAAIAWPNEVKQ